MNHDLEMGRFVLHRIEDELTRWGCDLDLMDRDRLQNLLYRAQIVAASCRGDIPPSSMPIDMELPYSSSAELRWAAFEYADHPEYNPSWMPAERHIVDGGRLQGHRGQRG